MNIEFVRFSFSNTTLQSIPLQITLTFSSFSEEDIDAVRPAYVKRMLAFAKACPNLVWVRFVATPEVNWTWEFSREGGVLKIDREEAVIRYKPKAGESVPPASGGVFMRESD